MSLTVEALAQEIISGHIIGPFNAKAVASQIFPFINRHIAERELAAAAYAVDEMQRVGHIAAGQQGAVGAVPDVKALANRILSTKTNNTDADDNALALIDVLSQAFGHDTISPAREWMEEAIFEALEATPQPPKDANGDIVREAIAILRDMPTDRIEYNEELSALIRKLKPASPKPAGEVPLPERQVLPNGIRREALTAPGSWTVQEARAIQAYGDAREAAGRAGAVPEGYCLMPMEGTPEIFTAMRMSVGDGVAMGPVYYAALSAGAIAAPIPQQPAAEGAAVKQSLTTEGAGGEAVGEMDLTAPPKVWLQIDPDGDSGDRSEPIPRHAWGDLAWCYESIGGLEVVYIRQDLANPTPAADAGGVRARPIDDYHEDMGAVTWWKLPVEEAAWIGTPLDSDWPGYHTHFTPHPQLPTALTPEVRHA